MNCNIYAHGWVYQAHKSLLFIFQGTDTLKVPTRNKLTSLRYRMGTELFTQHRTSIPDSVLCIKKNTFNIKSLGQNTIPRCMLKNINIYNKRRLSAWSKHHIGDTRMIGWTNWRIFNVVHCCNNIVYLLFINI